MKEDGPMSFYIVQEIGAQEWEAEKKPRSREVIYDKAKKVANCSCKMFKGEGIPCRHVLVV